VIGKTTTQPNIMLTIIRYQQSLTIFWAEIKSDYLSDSVKIDLVSH